MTVTPLALIELQHTVCTAANKKLIKIFVILLFIL